jgi:hypothetical protein
MQNVLADAGVPMIGAYWPPAWLALIPIIWIEALVARRTLRVSWRSAICSTGIANIASTLVGIPMTWLVWTSIENSRARGMKNLGDGIYAVTAQAPWLIPYEEHLWWMIPVAAFTLTVVFFLVSVVTEGVFMWVVYRRATSREVARWSWRANSYSYAVILLFVIVCLYVPTGELYRVSRGPVEFVIDALGRIDHWLAGPK